MYTKQYEKNKNKCTKFDMISNMPFLCELTAFSASSFGQRGKKDSVMPHHAKLSNLTP